MKKKVHLFFLIQLILIFFYVHDVFADVQIDRQTTLSNISKQVDLGLENPIQNGKETIDLGYFNGMKWFQLSLKNADSIVLTKYIFFKGLTGFVEVYEKKKDETYLLKSSFGTSVPLFGQDFKSIYSIAEIELLPQQEKTLYFKMNSRHNVNTSLFLGTLDEIKHQEMAESVFYYIYLGAILALILYNLFIYFYLKDSAYLRYCLFSVSFMITLSVMKGYADLFFENQFFSFSHYLMFFSSFSVLSASGFTYYFLEAYKETSLYKRIFAGINILAIFFMLVSLTPIEDRYPLYFGLGIDFLIILSNVFFIFLSIKKFKEIASAKFYLLSWFFVFIALIVWFSMTFGLLPQNFLTLNSLLLSSVAQMITLSLAIAYRMHQLKADKIVAEEKAFQKDRYQRLVRVLSHDIANSLSVVLLQAEKLAKDNSFSKEVLLSTYQKIIFAGNNIKKILERVRDQEKLNSQISQELNLKVFKLDAVFSEALLIFEEKLHFKKIELELNLQDSLLIKADQVCFLNHIVCNILSNAIKFSSVKSKIQINAQFKDSLICIEFIDHGIGIAEPFLSEMLKANRLVSTKGTSNEAGHGFGIPIIRDYVEFFGGKFQIDSVAREIDEVNSGTRVTLFFPFSEA